jgi:ribonuclease G
MLKKIKSLGANTKREKKEILINIEPLETRVAVLEDGRLDNFHIERQEDNRIVGSIFKGKIQNLEDGLQAAFVDIGLKKNAFIHYWDMIPEDAARLEREEGIRSKNSQRRRKRYKPGEMQTIFPIGAEIIVQVTKDAIGTKGPRVTANLSIPGRFLVMMPGTHLKGISRKIDDVKERNRLKKILARLPVPENIGLIVRTAGSGTRKVSFARDARTLFEIWKDIEEGIKNSPAPVCLYSEPKLAERVVRDYLTEDIDRIYIDNRDMFEKTRQIIAKFSRRSRNWVQLYGGEEPIFDYFDVEKQIESAYRRKVWMKSGAYLIFDETEALVAIDVNTGRHKGSKSQEESILQVNLESAEEVARQLRLRNVGGLVIVDFIDMKSKRDQTAVYRALKEALKTDRARTNVLQISQLGLLEMTRQRVEESIYTSSYTDCHYCRGRGRVKSPLSMSVEIQRRVSESMRKDRNGTHSMRVTVNHNVLDRLRKEDEAALIELETRFHGHLTFVSDAHYHMEEFSIINEDTGKVIYSSVEG